MKHLLQKTLLSALLIICVAACSKKQNSQSRHDAESLRLEIAEAVNKAPGRIGVAIITPEGDTITVGNQADYPMMSVFKMHQAIAVAKRLDAQRQSLDSTISIARASLDLNTWSPMLKEHQRDTIDISLRNLMAYAVEQSDNNASNILFERIVSVAQTDSMIRNAIGRSDFRIAYSEAQMSRDHSLSVCNASSPLACAVLLDRVFTDSLASPEKQSEIRKMLGNCATGSDRIKASLPPDPDIRLAHKTGSGYRDSSGLLMAHNDVGRITLPSGRAYTIAVLVTDFPESETQASNLITSIASIAYRHLAD